MTEQESHAQEKPESESTDENSKDTIESSSSFALKDLLRSGKEAVAIWGGLVGLFVAILWIAGRFYASGYFEAMNIPRFQVSFSIWEYAEVSWRPLILYSTIILWIVGFSFWISVNLMVVLEILIWLLSLPKFLNKITQWIGSKVKTVWKNISREKGNLLEKFFRSMLFILYFTWACILVISSLYFSEYILTMVRDKGGSDGKQVVWDAGTEVEFVAEKPLTLENPEIISTTVGGESSSLFVYEGYRLLTFNEGRYFVFDDIITNTCRPKKVYILDEEQFVQVNLSPSLPLTYSLPLSCTQKP